MSIEPTAVYTMAQVAELLSCSLTNAYDLVKTGQLARVAVGAGKKGYRVLGSDLLAFLEFRREGGPKPMGTFKHLGRWVG